MAYTPNVPQGNQTIAATQAPILTNFTFLQTAIGADHNFDITGSGSNCYHNKASMPNIVTPVAMPAGTDGIFYVKNAAPKFINAAAILDSGEYSIVNSYKGNAYYRTGTGIVVTEDPPGWTNLITLPANSFGSYFIGRNNGSSFYDIGTWNTGASTLVVFSDHEQGFRVQATGLVFQVKTSAGSGTYNNVNYAFQIITP